MSVSVAVVLDLHLLPEWVAPGPAVIHETLAATRAFDGCLGVEVLIDTADDAHVVLLERWASAEHDAAYRAWRATPQGASQLRDIVSAPPQMSMFTPAIDV